MLGTSALEYLEWPEENRERSLQWFAASLAQAARFGQSTQFLSHY